MVLESIIPIKTAEKQPIEMLPLAFLYASIGIFIGYWIFPNYASLSSVFFTVLALVPLMVSFIKFEEKDVFKKQEKWHHKKAIPFFCFMFLGLVFAYSFWFIVFPSSLIGSVFGIQLNTINQINSQVTGNSAAVSFFSAILSNNLKVLIFCLLFSFIYGAGAIFILVWNASVVSAAIGNGARALISKLVETTNLPGIAVYFSAFSLGLLRYMSHGIFEMIGYFLGGLAGGLISVAILRHEFMDNNFKKVMLDSLTLTLFSIAVLILAAVIEVTFSPLIPFK